MQIYPKGKETQNTALNAPWRENWRGTGRTAATEKITVSGAERILLNSQDMENCVRNAGLHKKEFVNCAVRIFLIVHLMQNIALIADKNKNRQRLRFSATGSAKPVNTGAITRITVVTIFQLQGSAGIAHNHQTVQSTKKENEF